MLKRKGFMVKVLSLFLVLILAAFAVFPACAPAEEEEIIPEEEEEEVAPEEVIVWRFHTQYPPTRRDMQDIDLWADRIRERSGGRLDIVTYHAAALGLKQADLPRHLDAGDIEAAWLSPGMSPDCTWGALMATIGVLFPGKEGKRDEVKLREVQSKLAKERMEKDWNIKWLLATHSYGINHCLFSTKRYDRLADSVEMKLRIYSKHQAPMGAILGWSTSYMESADLYMGLKTGVMDGSLYHMQGGVEISLHEVTNYVHIYSWWASSGTGGWMAGGDAWNALPADLKAIVNEASEWVEQERFFKLYFDLPDEEFFAWDAPFEKIFRDAGGTIINWPDEDWLKASKAYHTVWKEWCEAADDPWSAETRLKVIKEMGWEDKLKAWGLL